MEPQELTQQQSEPETQTPDPSPAPDSAPESDLDAFAQGVAEASEPEAEAEAAPEPEAAPAAEAAPAPEADPVAEEIAALGLKEKSAERFKELAGKVKELSTERETLQAAAQRAEQWEQMVTSTGATPEQYSSALGYLSAINSGDPAAMGKAFDAMLGELQWLGKTLGREVTGLVDPLQDHADLAEAVDAGDMTRKAALEVAQARVTLARTAEQAGKVQQQTAAQQAQAQAVAAVNALDQRLQADPLYAAKMQAMQQTGAFAWIKDNLPPEKWAAAIEREWQRTTVAAPPKPRPAVGHVPLRPVRQSAPMHAAPKNDLEAFELGVSQVGA
jgi:hypothetical protein